MRINLTDGQSMITVHFDPKTDARVYQSIRESNRPVTMAVRHAIRRLMRDNNDLPTLWPIQGVALEGLDT